MVPGSSFWTWKMSEISTALPNGKVSIREFIFPDDYSQVYSFWQRCGPGIHLRRSDEAEEIAKKLTRDPDLFLVAETDKRIIGTVIGGFDGRRGMVYHLAVEAEYRQKGLGEKLMTDVEERLRARGCVRCYLLVTPDNVNAMRFYQKRGWARMPLYAYGKDL
jgi:ribosomal protein S18 acetylase RimI-like enzyme